MLNRSKESRKTIRSITQIKTHFKQWKYKRLKQIFRIVIWDKKIFPIIWI
jgi:hypothetical protein